MGASILLVVALLGLSSCSQEQNQGNVAWFCRLLEDGTGLQEQPLEEDLADLLTLAPIEVRPTIISLQHRSRSFADLRAEDPPNLKALFQSRFDPEADAERAALDDFAANSCGIEVDRPPALRWSGFLASNEHAGDWQTQSSIQFEVTNEVVSTVTVVFLKDPEPLELAEQACKAAKDFLVAEGSVDAEAVVLVNNREILGNRTSNGSCSIP